MTRNALLVLALLGLVGCVHNPPFKQPALPVPATWPTTADGGAKASEVPWREYFPDERLRQVIQVALDHNRDLRQAALNIEKAQALYRVQRAPQLPIVNASASGNLYRLTRSTSFGGFSVGQAVIYQQYQVNLGTAAWELDLFGRIRSLKEAALERYLATEQAHSATQIALVAGVAQSYLALAADQENLRLARQTLEAQQATLDLVRRSREAGVATELDVRQAQTQVEAAQGDIVHYAGQVELDRNALQLLAGAPVEAQLLPAELGPIQAWKELSAEMPSTVLLRRPDIRMAEHDLKSAYASIGAARAAYFPRIALTAGGGLMSSDLSKLFQGSAATWNFAPQLSLPIFDGGARKANLRIAQVDRDLAVAEYEKSIQTAFREVSDSLSERATLAGRQSAQEALVRSLAETHRLAEARYRAGIDGYLTVLVAQRALYSGEQGLVGLRLARLGNLVTLYKVLGGGL